MEFRDEIQVFNEATADMRVCEYSINEVLAEILLFVSDKDFIDTGIEDLSKQFRLIHGRNNDEGEVDEDNKRFIESDGNIMGDAVANLAHSMVARFKDLELYLTDGNLPFEFKECLVPDLAYVFVKQTDFKPTIEREEDEYNPNCWHESRIPDSDPEHVYEGSVVEGEFGSG